MASYSNVTIPQLTPYKADALIDNRFFDPEKILGQQLAKTMVDFTYPFGLDGVAPSQATCIDPSLNRDMRLGFELEVALAGILAVVVFECPFDVHRMRVMSLNEIGIVAVHGPHQIGERGQQTGGQKFTDWVDQ